MSDFHQVEHGGDPFDDLFLGPAQLQRRERHFIEHRGIEELDFRILEHQPHATAEVERESVLAECIGIERATVEGDGAGIREVQAIEQPQQCGLAGPVRSQQRHALPAGLPA